MSENTQSSIWAELNEIDNLDPVLEAEVKFGLGREEHIKDAIELAHKQQGLTKDMLTKGATAITHTVKEDLDEKLFADIAEDCEECEGDCELDEELFTEDETLDKVDGKKPFNAADYKTEEETRLAFELYMKNKYGKGMNETIEDDKAFCPVGREECKVFNETDVTPTEKEFSEIGKERNEEIVRKATLGESSDPFAPPEKMWVSQGEKGLDFDEELEEDWTDQPDTASNALGKVTDKINEAQSLSELIQIVNDAIPESRKEEKAVKRFLDSLSKDKTVDKGRQHVYNFILADKDAVIKEDIVMTEAAEDDFLTGVIDAMIEPKDKMKESLKLVEHQGDRNISFLYDWFQGEDTGDWGKAYRDLLELNSPNALAEYKKLSDSGQAYIAQEEFNKLPNDVIALVDRDVNRVWLTRKEEPKILERLINDLTEEDRQILPHVRSVTEIWAERAKDLVQEV